MEVKKRLLLASIILIFLIFASYNFASYIVHTKYDKATSINVELEEVMEMVRYNQTIYDKLEQIDEDVRFINYFCFEEGDGFGG